MRAEFSAAARRAIWKRADGRCEGTVDVYTREFVVDPQFHRGLMRRCNAPLENGCFAYDHVITSWMSGRNDPANGQLLCLECHKAKTATDVGAIAKVKRIHRKAKGRTSRRPMPFGKGSKFKRKIGGKVVPR